MTEQEYRELEPLYDQAKREIPLMPRITIGCVQRQYMLGYNRAARLLETLAEHKHLKYDNVTGRYSRVPTTGNAP